MVGIIYFGNMCKGQNKSIEYFTNQLNDFIDDKIFIDLYKGNKLSNLFYKDVSIEKLLLDKFDNWNDIENYITDFLKKFDVIIIHHSCMMSGFKNGDNKLINTFLTKYKINNKYSMNFSCIRKFLEKVMIMKVAADTGKKVIHIASDPQEPIFNDSLDFDSYKRYFILKRPNEKYIPCYEYEMFKDGRKIIEKNIDLFFIGSIMTKDRYFLYDVYDEMKNIKGMRFEICDRDVYKANRIKQNEYYDFLSKARYTIIIKPYEHDSFSIIRFFEAISNNCIPLILNDVCLNEVKNTFPDIYDIIIKYDIFVDINAKAIQKRMQNYDNDKSIIKEIKESKSFKKITNYDKVKNFYDKMLGV